MAIPISNVTRRVVYAASGTGPYAFTFEILANTDIAVYRDDTLLTLTTNYTVTINSNGTGSITLTAAPTGATQIAIVGNRTIQRTTDFVTGGDFFANTVNDEMDQQTIFAQQNAEGLQRALLAPQTDPTTINMTLPAKATRANKTLSFDANGNPSAGVSAADVANAVTYATNAANSATAAASSASSASSSASAASASASTASTQASNASTSATNASNSASSASTSATNAASSASTASTQASNASTSATNAASSASAASTSASNAATSATNASNSATTASTQASNAATSASNASSSATSAANSAAAAASALDSFDDRYLGTKTSDPTLDNDGNALVAGALYFSTTENVMKVYDGASWITATSAGATSLLRFRYVATSGQTTFSGADSAAATLTYTVNNIAVHRNGVTLDTSEYTASNGTSIVLNVAAGTGDIVDIIAFKSFTVADALSAVSGGTVNGSVGITGNLGFTGTGNRITGDFSNATVANRVMFQTSTTNGNTTVNAIPNGTSQISRFIANNNSDPTNCAVGSLDARSTEVALFSTINGSGTYLPMTFYTGGSERVRVDTSGNVGIGTSSPVSKLDVQTGTGDDSANSTLTIRSSGNQRLDFYNNWSTATGVRARIESDADSISQLYGTLKFYTTQNSTVGVTERMRITSGGNLLVGATVGGGFTVFYAATDCINSRSGAAAGNATSLFVGRYSATSSTSGTLCFNVTTNGNVTNANNSYGSLSDVKLKENIVDVSPKLADLMQVRIVNYNFKEGQTHKQIGVVAQELEQVFPSMIEENSDYEEVTTTDEDGNETTERVATGTTTKSVKYSVFVPMLIKALQEQQAIIVTMREELDVLKAKVGA